jgi:hypothetical protein
MLQWRIHLQENTAIKNKTKKTELVKTGKPTSRAHNE